MTTIAIDARKLADFGIGTYIRGLIEGLARLDAESDYVLLGDPAAGADLETPPNFRWLRESSRGYSLRELYSVSMAVRRAGANLLHVPHYVVPLRAPCPVLVTIHDLIHLRFSKHRSALARIYARTMLRRATRIARTVFAVSEATRSELVAQLGTSPAKIQVTPNGLDEHWFATVDPEADRATLSRLGLAAGYLLFVGNPMPHKNLNGLIAAYAELVERRPESPMLLFVGGASAKSLSAEGGTWAAKRLLGRLGFLGVVATSDLPAIYRGAAALVLPSHWEGFGLPALEAMASGTPVVVSNRGALPELVRDAGLLVDPDRPETIALAMERVLLDPSLRVDLALRGRERAARFRWHETARQTLAAYRRVLADSPRRSRGRG